MATIHEKVGILSSLGPGRSRLDVPFLIRDAIYRLDAHLAIHQQLPATYVEAGRTLALENYDLEELGNGVWEAVAHYSDREPKGDTSSPEGGGGQNSSNPFTAQSIDWGFETNGGTVHITKSLGTITRTLGSPDFQGAINVNNESVQGTDIEAAGFAWWETHYFPRIMIGAEYIDRLRRLSQGVNNADWTSAALGIVFPTGDVRFRYATGATKDNDQVTVTYHFVAELTVEVEVGAQVLTKRGQDYYWTRFEEAESEHTLIPRPRHGYVEQVYQAIDFAHLEP